MHAYIVSSYSLNSYQIITDSVYHIAVCWPMQDGITHTNRDNKTSVSFMWTAPPQGTGGVMFR